MAIMRDVTSPFEEDEDEDDDEENEVNEGVVDELEKYEAMDEEDDDKVDATEEENGVA
jgi:hypothetical protein